MALSGLKKRSQTKALPEPTESDAESGNSGDESVASAQGEGNAGWADSIAKVLGTTKPKTKKTLVLSRAKRTKPGDKKAEDFGFEVEGEIKNEKLGKDELDDKSKLRKNQNLALRVKPSWQDIERERTLRKIATKGVVQLFNAVRLQQKEISQKLDEAGPLDSRKEAVLNNINKRKFLDVLMSGKRAKSEAIDNDVKNELKNEDSSDEDGDGSAGRRKSEWSVLRDDFMTNKKIKHWDNEDEDSENGGPQSAASSDEEE